MTGFDFNWDEAARKPVKCQHCRRERGQHRAHTLECPYGVKTRIGYLMFGPTVWTPKDSQKSK